MKSLKLAPPLLAIISTLTLLNACSEAKMPEVNDVNCKHENILKIKNKEVQQEFADKCFLRSNFKPSKKKEW